MFKHLGTFAVLAVCLFAIVIVMGGCDETRQVIVPPSVEDPGTVPPVEVTQQRFTGTLTVPDDELQGLAWNPQGTMLAAGYWGDEPDFGVWLYDTATGEYLKNLKGDFGDGVDGVAWGSALFIDANNKDLQMWDPATGQHLRTIANDLYSMAISPDSRIIAVDVNEGIRLIDIGTGQVLRTIISEEEEYDWISHAIPAFSPDGSTIAFGTGRREGQEDTSTYQVHLYDVATGRKKVASPDLGSSVHEIAWNSDGSRIAGRLWGDIYAVVLLDAATGQPIAPADDDPVGIDASAIEYPGSIAWSPTAPNILAVGGDGVIELVDIATWQILKTLTFGDDVDHLAFSPDGKTLASGEESPRSIRLWDVSDVW